MSAKSSGNTRFITMRFSTMYDTPLGTRRLSSSTYSVPSRSRTRSLPQMCAHTLFFGVMPTHCGRKFTDSFNSSAGNTLSLMILWPL
jgi:hypothetical protein